MSYNYARRDHIHHQYRRQYSVPDLDNYVHDTIMFLVRILEKQPDHSMDLKKLTVELCERGNTKPLKKVASGDSVEERLLAFVWQHPALFVTSNRVIRLRPMEDDIDKELEATLEDRLIEFLIFRFHQYGPCQIPISKLMGNLHQAASDIRLHFNDYPRFYQFIVSRPDIFTLTDFETIALKSDLDQANKKHKPLLRCDEYCLDERVLNCTKMVGTLDEGMEIANKIIATKDIVAIDCEGVNLGAPHGYITLVQVAVIDDLPENYTDEDVASAIRIFLFDIQAEPDLMYLALRKIFKHRKLTKIFQGCSSDATALFNRYKIVCYAVFDTVIAHRHLHEGAKSDLYYLYEFYVGEGTNRMKKDIKKKYIINPRLWTTRPLGELLTYYAAFDVFALIRIYFKLKEQIDQNTYEEIFKKSISTAQAAYYKKLPANCYHMWDEGWSASDIHDKIGLDPDSEDDKPGGSIFSNRKRGLDKRTGNPDNSEQGSRGAEKDVIVTDVWLADDQSRPHSGNRFKYYNDSNGNTHASSSRDQSHSTNPQSHHARDGRPQRSDYPPRNQNVNETTRNGFYPVSGETSYRHNGPHSSNQQRVNHQYQPHDNQQYPRRYNKNQQSNHYSYQQQPLQQSQQYQSQTRYPPNYNQQYHPQSHTNIYQPRYPNQNQHQYHYQPHTQRHYYRQQHQHPQHQSQPQQQPYQQPHNRSQPLHSNDQTNTFYAKNNYH